MSQRKKWRIYQFLSSMGSVSSKAEAVELARSGKITVNGKVTESLHYQINPVKDVVCVDGKRVELKENRRYFVFHKPFGVLCTKDDILKFFNLPSDVKNSMYPVGRLDKNSSGLLIVTNDGRLGQRVLNPKSKRKKVYEVVVEGDFSDFAVGKLRKGVAINTVIDGVMQNYTTLPASVHVVSHDSKSSKLFIGIFEGKKRQVRLMCKAVGFPVVSLKRISIGKLELGDLKSGKYREIDKKTMFSLLFE